MKKHPIVIMAAMEVEANFLLEKLENVICKDINKYKFYEGTIKGFPVVICRCNVMSINAAIATYMAIKEYNPIAIISQGTAGALGKDIHKGDIIVGEKCINITSCKTPYKNEGEGSNSLDWNLVSFICGEDDRLEYHYGNKHLIELSKEINYENGNIHFGTIGSGDVWNQEIDKLMWLHDKYEALCEDMESIAIYTVANDFSIPVLGIKVISDNAILGEDYDRNMGMQSQLFTYELVLKLISENKK